MIATSMRSDRREQIDGLRVIAMTGVLYVHFWADRPTLEFVRVSLFFIISGFLIGIILLSAKETKMTINVVNFYIRRFLRLLPALFLMLAIASLFNMDDIRRSIYWHVLQLSSVYFMINEIWKPWVASHLWSLNIVEQFYITAPIFIMYLSKKNVLFVYLLIIAFSIALRINYRELGLSEWTKVIFSFDPVAAGTILALAKDNVDVRAILTSKLNNFAAIIILCSPFVVGHEFGHSEAYRILSIYALSSIVLSAYVGYNGLAAFLLANPVTRFLSRVSYATYVYHLAVWWLVAEQWPFLYQKGPLAFFVVSAATIVTATLSWHLVEKHFDALKASFPTVQPATFSPKRA